MKRNITFFSLLVVAFFLFGCNHKGPSKKLSESVLKWDQFSHYVDAFNQNDNELYQQFISNSKVSEFLKENIPYLDCPDKELETTYYFRWWTYRKHIKKTPEGFVITEFLPKVPWSGKYNTINCPAGHHFYEGRWLHNVQFLSDYANFWFRGGGNPRQYSFWAGDAILAFSKVHDNEKFIADLLPDLVANYEAWEKERGCDDGLYWQSDNLDGMEVSIGGSGKRATINSYIYGDAVAISQISQLAHNDSLEHVYKNKAEKLKQLVVSKLWDQKAAFFKTLPTDGDRLVNVRELHGYIPWYFNLPNPEQSIAWKQILTEDGFKAPYGLTSAEQRHSSFNISYEGHECQWNGPSWPFATTQTLKGMANLIRNYEQDVICRTDYMEQLKTYCHSHFRKREDGKNVSWIDENLNPYTGDWISRTRLKSWENGSWCDFKGGVERGKDYNHSGFCDLVINDLIGVIPSMTNELIINPLLPENLWDWFCLDHLKYHGHNIIIIWDKVGKRYDKGKGLLLYVDGKLKAQSPNLTRLTLTL